MNRYFLYVIFVNHWGDTESRLQNFKAGDILDFLIWVQVIIALKIKQIGYRAFSFIWIQNLECDAVLSP